MRTAADTSMMICGCCEALSPANSSTATTLSSEKRAIDCADAGAAHATTKMHNAEHAKHADTTDPLGSLRPPRLNAFKYDMSCIGGDARQRVHERADDFGVELGAGPAPQLAHRI